MSPAQRKKKSSGFGKSLISILVLVLLIRTVVVQAYQIPSGSMEDTLLVGDFLLANRFIYGAPIEIAYTGIVLGHLPAFDSPKRGDILIFASWTDTTLDYIKRCVGIAGDTVMVRDGVLTVNGKNFQDILKERYPADDPDFPLIKHERKNHPWARSLPDRFGPHIVGPKSVFMMGDNRDNSADSRVYGHGDMPLYRLKARAMIIYFSIDHDAPWWNLAKLIRWNRIGKLIY